MKNRIEQMLREQIEDLKALVRIPSVSRGDPAEPGKPFGKTVYEALQATLAIARRLGLKAWDVDGYCGVVEYGEGDEVLGILAHLDVVPEGEGWSVPPYSATEKDGRIIGRGTLDDKSPALSAIYALAAIKDCGFKMKRRVRVILGCDEEIGSLGVEHYLKVEGEPTLAFTPDAEYPVVNSEMGIMHTTYEKKYPSALQIDCGTAANVIPGVIRATLPKKAVPVAAPEGFAATYDENRITVEGRGGHASMPEFAKNALQALMDILTKQPLPEADLETVNALHALWGYDMHGESLGIDVTDESERRALHRRLPPPVHRKGGGPSEDVGRGVRQGGLYPHRYGHQAGALHSGGQRARLHADERLQRTERLRLETAVDGRRHLCARNAERGCVRHRARGRGEHVPHAG